MLARPLPRLAIPLAEDLAVTADRGEEIVVELGSVPVRGADARGVTVVVHVVRCSGRGTWCLGLWWSGEANPAWAEQERHQEPSAVALPIEPGGDGVDRQVGVLFRLRPLGPSRRCEAVIRAEVRIPLAPTLTPPGVEGG